MCGGGVVVLVLTELWLQLRSDSHQENMLVVGWSYTNLAKLPHLKSLWSIETGNLFQIKLSSEVKMTSSGQTQFYHPPQPSFLRYRSKPLESSGTGHRHSAIRHSGDFDLFTGARPGVLASSSATRLPGLGQGRPINNVFRRAKSTEWDRDVLANNVAGLRYVMHWWIFQ